MCIEFSDFRTTVFCTSYFIFFFGKISSYLKNPYSLTKVKTRDSGSLEMYMVGFVVVWLVGFYLCCVPGLGNSWLHFLRTR